MTPLYFGAAGMPLFGWLHLPEASVETPTDAHTAAPALAVLLCAPLGHEDLATHRGQRRLAQALAAAGLPTLRFDYAGCGDSADAPASPATWLQSIHAAADELRARSGAARLALVGVRMGALLAASAACSRADVAALVALLPVHSGRAWLRESRLLGDAAPRAHGAATDLGGLVFDAAGAAAVSALHWPASGALRPAEHALVIERDDLGSAPGPAVQALRALGTEVLCERLGGLDRLTAVAHSAHTPQALIERATGWLVSQSRRQAQCEARSEVRVEAQQPVPSQALSQVPLQSAAPLSTFMPAPAPAQRSVAIAPVPLCTSVGLGAVDERAVCIGIAPRLVGVLTSPAATTAAQATAVPRRGVLLLSSGAERRVGPNRLWVAFARRRAAAGDLVLRLDLAGIGDSDERAGAAQAAADNPHAAVYDPRCVADIDTALAWLRREHGVQRCDVVGVCSGAYHAWRAALQGVEVSSVVAINPLVFHWQPGMSLDPTAHAFGQLAISADAARAARDPARWLKLLRGEVHVRIIVAALLARCRAAPQRLARNGLRSLGVSLQDDLASELRTVARRGVVMHFVFAPDEPGLWLLRQEAARSLIRLQRQGRVHVVQVDAADHTFTQQQAREALYDCLHRALDATPTRAGPAHAPLPMLAPQA